MPLEVDSLTKESSRVTVRNAIAASIKKQINEGKDTKQAAAIAYDIARKRTGKQIGKEA